MANDTGPRLSNAGSGRKRRGDTAGSINKRGAGLAPRPDLAKDSEEQDPDGDPYDDNEERVRHVAPWLWCPFHTGGSLPVAGGSATELSATNACRTSLGW
jgi:hypothetical protein